MTRLAATVVVAGPDGAGKSTLAARLADEVLSPPVLRLHHRPGLLRARTAHAGPVTQPHAEPPYTVVRSLLKLVYLYVDYQVGWSFKVRPVRRRGGSVLLERGWWDLAVDPRRYRLVPTRWAPLLARSIPSPDLTVILVADPEVLFSRSAELSRLELVRQLEEWRRIAAHRERMLLLDAAMPVHELVERVRSTLQDCGTPPTSRDASSP
jgi:hypothetical protein